MYVINFCNWFAWYFDNAFSDYISLIKKVSRKHMTKLQSSNPNSSPGTDFEARRVETYRTNSFLYHIVYLQFTFKLLRLRNENIHKGQRTEPYKMYMDGKMF